MVLIAIIALAGILVAWLGITRKDFIIRTTLCAASLILFGIGGFFVGRSWEHWQNYEQYIWRFSQYSGHIRGLAERQEIAELTNAVILFDSKFYPRAGPESLEDVIFQLRKQGAYYVDETNAEVSLQASTNTSNVR